MTPLIPVFAAMAMALVVANFSAQAPMPFKLGTFEQGGRTFVGIVLKDSIVIDIAQASAALKNPAVEGSGAGRHEGLDRAL